VLVAGGELEQAGLAVHTSPEEQALLEHACAEAARVARLVVLFGPAAARLARFFDRRRTILAPSLDDAIAVASTHAADAKVLVVSPMFPLPLADRERITRPSSSSQRPGIASRPSALVAVTTIMCAIKGAPTREEST
jgi:hypothetical protein